MMRRPRRSTLFPYTTRFRSREPDPQRALQRERVGVRFVLHVHRHCLLGVEPSDPALDEDRRPADPADLLDIRPRSEEHTSELQSQSNLVCRLLLEKKKNTYP